MNQDGLRVRVAGGLPEVPHAGALRRVWEPESHQLEPKEPCIRVISGYQLNGQVPTYSRPRDLQVLIISPGDSYVLKFESY